MNWDFPIIHDLTSLLNLSRLGKFASAMRTTSGAFLNLFQAEGAGCHRLELFLLVILARKLAANLLGLVDCLNQAKNDKSNDKEVDAGANEGTEIDVRARDNQTRHRASTATGNEGNKGVDDVGGKGRDDAGECTTDDDCHRQIHNIAAINEFLELDEEFLGYRQKSVSDSDIQPLFRTRISTF